MQKAAAIIVYVAVALALIVLIICPIVSIFARSIITDGKLDWSNLVQLFPIRNISRLSATRFFWG